MAPQIVIQHGGQTGVDRGAHEGALAIGLRLGGFAPSDGRDELGPIPIEVHRYLTRCPRIGLYARTAANVASAHALLVIVADAVRPYETPGTRTTLDEARRRPLELPRLVVDPTHPRARVVAWASTLIHAHPPGAEFRLMVAGPRASRWPGGQSIAASFVGLLAGVA